MKEYKRARNVWLASGMCTLIAGILNYQRSPVGYWRWVAVLAIMFSLANITLNIVFIVLDRRTSWGAYINQFFTGMIEIVHKVLLLIRGKNK